MAGQSICGELGLDTRYLVMECSCGGLTQDRETVVNQEVVNKYARCSSCGRVHVYWVKPAPTPINGLMEKKDRLIMDI